MDIELLYDQFQVPLVAGAFATHVTGIVCPADISITKTADEFSKVGDPVTYTFEICNDGDATVNRDSVLDTLIGDIGASFPATLAAGACATVTSDRTVADGDPDPLVNTVTAEYSSGSGILTTTDTATAVPPPSCSSRVSVSPRTARQIPLWSAGWCPARSSSPTTARPILRT